MKILIAYDGSSCADAALNDLQCAGLPPEAEALILSVAEVFLPPPSPTPAFPAHVPPAVQRAWTQATHVLDEAHTLAQQARARLLTSFPAWDVCAEACADSPAWAVVKKADTWQPDLIVVGSHGRSALSRFVLGSVSQKILTEAHGSVRIGRQRHQTVTGPLHLLIGIDGSPDAAAAVQAVAARAWPADSSVRLVTALDARMYTALAFMRLPGETGASAQDADESVWMARTVDPMAELLRTRGLTVSSVITEGDPKCVLLDEAERWEADGLFVGARGLSRVERFLLGSVSAAVAARAHCAVEVVRGVVHIRGDLVSEERHSYLARISESLRALLKQRAWPLANALLVASLVYRSLCTFAHTA
jgi:nucleotide-binding universal stress UspA family protein